MVGAATVAGSRPVPDRLVRGGPRRRAHQREKGGDGTGPSPVNRGTPDSKHHVITDGDDTPLAVITTGGNVRDISKAVDLLDAVPPVAGHRGAPRRRRPVLLADKGYDSAGIRDACRKRRTEPIIPRPGRKHVKGLGKLRHVVEQSIALLHQFRRLAIRWERHLDLHDALVSLGCAPMLRMARSSAYGGVRSQDLSSWRALRPVPVRGDWTVYDCPTRRSASGYRQRCGTR